MRGSDGVSLLIEKGCDPVVILNTSAEGNDVESMRVVVEDYKVDVNSKVDLGEYKQPALVGAAKKGSVSAVKWLIEHGANVEATSDAFGSTTIFNSGSYTALWASCQNGHLRVIHLLLEAGADPNTYKNTTGNTALFMTGQFGHAAACSELLRHGADPNLTFATGQNRNTPLDIAVASCHLDVVALLISSGAVVDHAFCLRALHQMQRKGRNFLEKHFQKEVSADDLKRLAALTTGGGASLLQSNPHVGEHYRKAQETERRGQYHKALRHLSDAETALQVDIGKPPIPSQSPSPEWTQILLDEKRLVSAVYGVTGSDNRVSVWNQHIFEREDRHPTALHFYAWARHGDYIYRHGGVELHHLQFFPSKDVIWALNIHTKEWKHVKCSGTLPGPRARHVAFVHKDSFYILGGRNAHFTGDMKLYRLDLNRMVWSIVKTKGSKPQSREEFAAFVYKDKLYIHGGIAVLENVFLNDMWCFNLESCKWKEISSSEGTPRKSHCIFAARGTIYVFGGRLSQQVRRTI